MHIQQVADVGMYTSNPDTWPIEIFLWQFEYNYRLHKNRAKKGQKKEIE